MSITLFGAKVAKVLPFYLNRKKVPYIIIIMDLVISEGKHIYSLSIRASEQALSEEIVDRVAQLLKFQFVHYIK